jgi:hypothetical protein
MGFGIETCSIHAVGLQALGEKDTLRAWLPLVYLYDTIQYDMFIIDCDHSYHCSEELTAQKRTYRNRYRAMNTISFVLCYVLKVFKTVSQRANVPRNQTPCE